MQTYTTSYKNKDGIIFIHTIQNNMENNQQINLTSMELATIYGVVMDDIKKSSQEKTYRICKTQGEIKICGPDAIIDTIKLSKNA